MTKYVIENMDRPGYYWTAGQVNKSWSDIWWGNYKRYSTEQKAMRAFVKLTNSGRRVAIVEEPKLPRPNTIFDSIIEG